MSRNRTKNQVPESQGKLFSAPDDNYIEHWDEYFLAFAETASRKSKDPRCKVGAVIVRDKMVVSTGYNGLARGVYDTATTLEDTEEKLRMICHAEFNAIMNAARKGVPLEGTTMYVTKFPCLDCCNAIIQAGIKCVYTHDHKYWGDDPNDRDHTRKPVVLKQGQIDVRAPRHPDFGVAAGRPVAPPRQPPKRAASPGGGVATKRVRKAS